MLLSELFGVIPSTLFGDIPTFSGLLGRAYYFRMRRNRSERPRPVTGRHHIALTNSIRPKAMPGLLLKRQRPSRRISMMLGMLSRKCVSWVVMLIPFNRKSKGFTRHKYANYLAVTGMRGAICW